MLFESSARCLIHSVYKRKVAELSKYNLFSTKLPPVQSDDNVNIEGVNKNHDCKETPLEILWDAKRVLNN